MPAKPITKGPEYCRQVERFSPTQRYRPEARRIVSSSSDLDSDSNPHSRGIESWSSVSGVPDERQVVDAERAAGVVSIGLTLRYPDLAKPFEEFLNHDANFSLRQMDP